MANQKNMDQGQQKGFDQSKQQSTADRPQTSQPDRSESGGARDTSIKSDQADRSVNTQNKDL